MFCENCGNEINGAEFCSKCGQKALTEKERKVKATSKKLDTASKSFKTLGEGMQGCGCVIMLLPIFILLLYFVFSLIFS